MADLEDAVPLDRNDEARAQVAQWPAARGKGGAGGDRPVVLKPQALLRAAEGR